jgi:hypothetical protein
VDQNDRRFAANWEEAAPPGQRVVLRPFVRDGQEISRGAAESRRDPDMLPTEFPREPERHASGLAKTTDRIVGLFDGHILSAAPRLRVRSARVSLTMVVRNEQANLRNVLASVKRLFNEIVVVATGPTCVVG